MTAYQGLAKKYRPQKFSDLFDQDSIVQTLKNALLFNRVSHAYIFCGTRGTGKTTLARLFAKAINCQNRSENQDPCNTCQSCAAITSGHSLDVIEIDGASNRGIDDIRNLNETVEYASSSGKYKIYIIDEVHMLTKEAFNALLKTLEEPPEHVIFFFATTEPHKVLPTILSRCQRFNLKRISPEKIQAKLLKILRDLKLKADPDALSLIAAHAEGSLRDAESLLDQLLCYHSNEISVETVSQTLGLVSRDVFFQLDRAAEKNDLLFPFKLSQQMFKQGSHFESFLESLANHYRNILLLKLGEKSHLSTLLSQEEKESYLKSESIYTKTQCLEILDILRLQFETISKTPFKRINLEILLLQIIRSMKKMPLDHLVDRLTQLKASINSLPLQNTKPTDQNNLLDPPKETPEKEKITDKLQKKIRHDRVMQFASIELNGSLNLNSEFPK